MALTDLQKEKLRLPEVVVENLGLHVGGEANDAASKRAFLAALEKQFQDFRWCYRFVSKPGRSGVFGVDLLVPSEGGGAHVREVRTTMPGEEFKGCMVAAFSETEFAPPKRPVVLSYSLRFTIRGPAVAEAD